MSGYNPIPNRLTLYSDNIIEYPDESYYDSDFVSFENSVSGESFTYNTKESTFSLTKNAKYTLLVTCTGWRDGNGVDRGSRIEYLKLKNNDEEFFNKPDGNFVTRKIEVQGPVSGLYFESSLSYASAHSTIGVIGGTMVILCKE